MYKTIAVRHGSKHLDRVFKITKEKFDLIDLTKIFLSLHEI